MSQALAAAVMAVQRGLEGKLEARLSSAAAAHKESLAAIRGEASTALARADRCLALNSQLQERVAAQLASVERRQGRVRIEAAAAPPAPPAQQVAASSPGATAAQVAASMANASFAPVAHVQLPSHAPSVSPVTAKAAAPAPAPAPVPPPPAASVPASAVGGGGGSTRAGARKAGARPLGRKSSTRSSKSTTSTSSKRLRRAGSRTGSASSLSSFASSTSSAREVSLALTKDERRRLRKVCDCV